MALYKSDAWLRGIPTPAGHGLSAWAFDPVEAINSSTAANGIIHLIKMLNPPADPITKIFWGVATAAVTPTAGQNWAGLYDAAGNRIQAVSADADSAVTGLKVSTIPSTLWQPGMWVALLFNAATAPLISRSGTGATVAALANAGLAAAAYRFATNSAGQTTLPATIVPSANAVPGFVPWAAVGQ